ncbi:MAG TPA: hypothetical protein VGB94_07035 [Acidobacteriaceae bacterium]
MNILRRYFYWTYERGDFHYDVMVTFILAFIFVTPHLWNYKDTPAVTIPLQASQVLVKAEGTADLTFEVRAADLSGANTPAEQNEAILRVIEPISGTVEIERTEPILDANRHVVAYKVWVTH